MFKYETYRMEGGSVLLSLVVLGIFLLYSCQERGGDKNMPTGRADSQRVNSSLGESQDDEILPGQAASSALERR